MLDNNIKNQLKSHFESLTQPVELLIALDDSKKSTEVEGLALRGTFVMNPEGEIKIIETHDLGIGRSAKELVRKVQAAQYIATHDGEVCPASWQPGEDTLAPSLDLVGKI